MKKLFIALFAFVAVFAVAGSASAVEYFTGDIVPPHYSTFYDAGNGEIAVAYQTGTDLHLVWTIDSGDRTAGATDVVTGIDFIVGVTNITADDSQFIVSYLINGGDLRRLEYDIDIGKISDVLISSNVYQPYMAEETYNGEPVFLTSTGNATNAVIIRFFAAGSWQENNFYESEVDGPRSIFVSGKDAYIMASDAGTIYHFRCDMSISSTTMWEVVETLDANPIKIDIIGMDGSSPEAVYQTSGDLSKVYIVSSTGGAYSSSQIMGMPTGQHIIDWEAAGISDTEAEIIYVYFTGEDEYNTTYSKFEISSGDVSITETVSSDNVTDVDFAISFPESLGFFSGTVTYTVSDTLDKIYLYNLTSKGPYTFQLAQQQENGNGAIPELPGNTLWKVLLAILSLGLVVGIAAFMKKKKK